MSGSEQKVTIGSFFRIAAIVLGLLAVIWFLAQKIGMPQNEINLLFGSAVLGIVLIGFISLLSVKLGKANKLFIKGLSESTFSVCFQCGKSFEKAQMRRKRRSGYFCQSCYRKDELTLAIIAVAVFLFLVGIVYFLKG